MNVNTINLIGRVIRMDYRFGLSKAGKEFLSATFTLDIEGNQIKTETFAMKMKSDGSEESGGYKSLMTIWNESNALHKTYRKQGEKEATVVNDETIVQNIEEATALKMSNWNGFKYCKFVPNEFTSASGELVKQTRIEFAYANRVKEEEGIEYNPTRDFEVCGLVKENVLAIDKNEVEYRKIVVIVPEYVEKWGEREESVKLQEVVFTSYDESAWDYIEENFKAKAIVYLNGEIFRKVERVEREVMEVEGRGFGRQMKQQPKFDTNIEERFEVLGGFVLEEDEIENMREFNQELWMKAMEQKQEEPKEKPVEKSFGRKTEVKKEVKQNNNPFGDLPF